MITLILAAGTQERWQIDNPTDTPKQLLDIGGTPLLERTLKQLERLSAGPVKVITHRDDLPGEAWSPSCSATILDTLRSTHSLWSDVTVVLLGDVVYSNFALATVYGCTQPVTFFGRDELRFRPLGKYYELFALRFTYDSGRILMQTLQTPKLLEPNPKLKLRHLYEIFAGLPPDKNVHERTFFYPMNDWTEDIDCLDDYECFCRAMERGVFDASC